MALRDLVVQSVEPYAGGRPWGEPGAYEMVRCTVRYAVDPDDPANAAITDLAAAPRGPDGCVAFAGDLQVLRPKSPGAGNGGLVVEIPNRGGWRLPYELPAGDGFLLRRGWTVAWCGWQWDIERGSGQLGLTVPEVAGGGSVRVEFSPPRPCAEHPLDRDLPGRAGRAVYPVADLAQSDAAMYARDPATGRRTLLPRGDWRFPTPGSVSLDGGFSPTSTYEVIYRTDHCPVAGLGLLAARDAVAHLRARGHDRAHAFGVSQSGRFLRQFLFHGLNVDEGGRRVFDGVHAHVAGARRGEFNARYGQASVSSAPGFCDLPPFDAAGLLAEQRRRGGLAKVILTNSAWEYWRGDAALGHIAGGADVAEDPDVRSYLLCAGDHLGGAGQLPGAAPVRNPGNDLVVAPLVRAAFINLDGWVRDGVAPPASRVPRVADGTAAPREAVWETLGRVPGFARPSILTRLFEVDLGPDADAGIARYPVALGAPLPVWVGAVDADGNEVGGLRLPDLSVPVATITGWNAATTGVLALYLGSRLPFARTRAERLEAGDPRPALEERYRDRGDYEARVRRATDALVADRLVLAEDVEAVVAACLRRFDRIAAPA